jgi:hypothetical protein
MRQYVQIGRALCRKGDTAGLVEETGADFFMGLLVAQGSPVAGQSIESAGVATRCCLLPACQCWCQQARVQPRIASAQYASVNSAPCLPALPPSLPAGLRNLHGQFVVSVRRGGQLVHAVGPEFMLAAGDVLYLSGGCQFWGQCPLSSPMGGRPVAPFLHRLCSSDAVPGCPLIIIIIIVCLLPPTNPCLAGIPDGTDKLSKLGLVPYSDALEEVDERTLPGLSSTFGVSSISGGCGKSGGREGCGGLLSSWACHSRILQLQCERQPLAVAAVAALQHTVPASVHRVQSSCLPCLFRLHCRALQSPRWVT